MIQLERCVKRIVIFLYINYTNIFNKLYKGDLDLVILDKFITILGQDRRRNYRST